MKEDISCFCKLCNIEIKNKRNFSRHYKSKTHKANEEGTKKQSSQDIKKEIINQGLQDYIEFMKDMKQI